ncbi:hypothetical protein BDN72DRAFT_834639 [Pluteus cervinus]|uniref:Uncharacterized protein n=1 Tax=Pluteus cervinus TaxID=181527 RepID=A0ACD3B5X5_9AGAR|nr:hypothetical protein BDN72DRAFT_834639 [Pluteus cervinus]
MSDPSQIPVNPVVLNIFDIYGVILIGNFFACILWGIAIMQTFLYFLNYGSDHWGIKALVCWCILVDTANQVLMLKGVFPVLILQYGRIAGLFESQIELLHHNYIAACVAVSVQQFFLYRIYIFSGRNWIFPLLMQPLVWWQVIGTIPYNVIVMPHNSLATISQTKVMDIAISLRCTMCAVDVLIAIAMAYLLKRNGQSTFRSSKKLVFRLIMITINTGMWTAILALTTLITQVVLKNTLWFCLFEFPLSSLYVNTLLANLNARRFIKGTHHDSEWNTVQPSIVGSNVPLSQLSRPTGQDHSVTIRVETSKENDGDEFSKFKRGF